MSNKILYAVVAVIVILIVGGVVYSQSKQTNAPEASNYVNSNQEQTSQANPETNTGNNNEAQGTLSDANSMEDTQAAIHQISFDGKAYTPNNITIKNGDIVVFKNNSDKDFWPASAPHPTHTAYPEFDAKAAVAPGKIFQFKFTKPGKWGFHDHLTPTAFGSVTVE